MRLPDDSCDFDFVDPGWPEVVVTDNPVVGRLYGPSGEVLVEQYEREPIGFRLR